MEGEQADDRRGGKASEPAHVCEQQVKRYDRTKQRRSCLTQINSPYSE